jgi:hypothetical protein
VKFSVGLETRLGSALEISKLLVSQVDSTEFGSLRRRKGSVPVFLIEVMTLSAETSVTEVGTVR